MSVRRNWTRDELILAFNLYCKTPFGRIHTHNPDIIDLASILGRTPSAVSFKLVNFARLDPALRRRGVHGASHGSKLDEEIWREFHSNWEELAFQSESLLAKKKRHDLALDALIDQDDHLAEGIEKERIVRVRVNQKFFRMMVFASYRNRCCITGLNVPELLNASHIVPWALDKENRLNPRNGLVLNTLHDRAFDKGLITIGTDYRVKTSSRITKLLKNEAVKYLLLKYDGVAIRRPDRFLPDPKFISYHNREVFLG